jgi:hypothetical protein
VGSRKSLDICGRSQTFTSLQCLIQYDILELEPEFNKHVHCSYYGLKHVRSALKNCHSFKLGTAGAFDVPTATCFLSTTAKMILQQIGFVSTFSKFIAAYVPSFAAV